MNKLEIFSKDSPEKDYDQRVLYFSGGLASVHITFAKKWFRKENAKELSRLTKEMISEYVVEHEAEMKAEFLKNK